MNYVTAESRTARLPQALPTPAAYLLFVRPPEVSGRGGNRPPWGGGQLGTETARDQRFRPGGPWACVPIPTLTPRAAGGTATEGAGRLVSRPQGLRVSESTGSACVAQACKRQDPQSPQARRRRKSQGKH